MQKNMVACYSAKESYQGTSFWFVTFRVFNQDEKGFMCDVFRRFEITEHAQRKSKNSIAVELVQPGKGKRVPAGASLNQSRFVSPVSIVSETSH